MKITDKIKSLIRRGPPSEKEVAAKAEVEIAREQALEDPGDRGSEANAQFP
jgi:hypothetical protein